MSDEQTPPDDAPGPREGTTWGPVVGGLFLGLMGWLLIGVVAFSLTGYGEDRSATEVAVRVFAAIVVVGVGLVAWPRTRRLGQGYVLGVALAAIVGGGLCIPMYGGF